MSPFLCRFLGIGRAGLILILMVNAIGPVSVAAYSDGSGSRPIQKAAKTIPVLEPEYAPTPTPTPPLRTDAFPDESAAGLPPQPQSQMYEFSLHATPAVVTLNTPFTMTVTVKNHSTTDLTGLVFADKLENGLEFDVTKSSSVRYDSSIHQVSHTISYIPAGESAQFEYTLKIISFNQGDSLGELWIHSATLSASGGVNLSSSTALLVSTNPANPNVRLAAIQPRGGWHALGRVSAYLMSNSVPEGSFLMEEPVQNQTSGPDLQFRLQVVRTAGLTSDSRGDIPEQRTAVSVEFDDLLDSPGYLTINLDGFVDLKNIPAGEEPYVVTLDERTGIWVKVPIQEINYEDNNLTVQAAHFSTWGAGLGSSLPQNGANALLFDQPYTSLFTGAARYSIPIWTPSGRSGMAPSIELSYSSSTVDGVLGDVQAPWVGEGWNIDSTEIVRKITTSPTGYGYENSFALTLNGVLYELVRDSTHPNRYYTKQDGFLYIELHSPALGNAVAEEEENKSKEWWEVVATDGTRYELGRTVDSEQLALAYGYSCTQGGDRCLTPDGAYASLGYAGLGVNVVAMRWRVDKATDTHGNYIEYSYDETQPPLNSQVTQFDSASYLKTINYTLHTSDPANPNFYQVSFELADRASIGDIPTSYYVYDFIDTKFLDKIRICYLACDSAGYIPIRTYDLGYTLAPAPNANGTLTLTSIAISGGNFTENGQFVGSVINSVQVASQAATVTFIYQNKPNRAAGTSDPFNYPRLMRIDNGYGGRLTFTYETDGRGTNSWYDYRIQKVQVNSGVDTAVVQTYAYQTPVYTGQGGNPNLGELIGYTTVTETPLDFKNGNTVLRSVAHTFGTNGLDIGRELTMETSIDGAVQMKITNSYVTDNSQAPFMGWNYRYLSQTVNYVRSGGALTQTSKTTYQRDPGTGDLVMQGDYIDTRLYRKTYYEYALNRDPSVYILDAVSRKLVTTAGNQVVSDVYYYYDWIDGIDDYQTSTLTKGDQTVVQARTGNGDQTVDSRRYYDIYGNVTKTRMYTDYGMLRGTLPGNYQESIITYDSDLLTYPETTINPLGEATHTDYLLSLGQPYQSTDTNGWTTTTTYDGLGRVLSVTPPGLSQAGVWYTYPVPNTYGRVTAPYSIQMQIFDETKPTYRFVWGIYDGLGRILQNQVKDDDQNKLLLTDTAFNAQGQPEKQSLTYYSEGNAIGGTYITPEWENLTYTSYQYDGLGRQTQVTAPGAIIAQTSYDGLSTTVTDPNGNLSKTTTDGLGRTVQVQEYNGTSLYATTRYSYNQADNLVRTVDSQLNMTTLSYDWLGRKMGMDDPDMGIWAYDYNATGTLASQSDARGEQLEFFYDGLNRLLEKREHATSTVLASYEFGDMEGSRGLRTRMEDQSGSTSWSYDNYGRAVTENKTIGNRTESITTVSDWLGRTLTVYYPDDEVINYQYDALGRPINFNSSTFEGVTLASLAYDALGRIGTTTLGNGVAITNTYDDALRLESRLAAVGTETPLLDFSYLYDDNGNITEITDGALGEIASYNYDSLNRLTSAVVDHGATPVYQQNYAYDKVGNILQVSNAQGVSVNPGSGSNKQASLLPLFPAGGASIQSYSLPESQQYKQNTDTPTPTSTFTPSPTDTPTPTSTYTPTDTPTLTPTATATQTPTLTSSRTPVLTGTFQLTPTPTVVPAMIDLVSWWSLDEMQGVRADLHGSNSLTDSNNVGSTTMGVVAGAASFNRSAYQSLSHSDNTDFATGNTPFTIALWVNLSNKTYHNVLISKSGTGNLEYQVYYNYSADRFEFRVSSDGNNWTSNVRANNFGSPSTGTWYYIIAWHDPDADTLNIQVNDSVVNTIAYSSGIRNGNGAFTLGYDGGNNLMGYLDEVAYWKRVLTATERNWLYNNGEGRSYMEINPNAPVPTQIPTNTPTLTPTMALGSSQVLYWSFNNVTSTIPDDSGHGYIGNMINGAAPFTYGHSGAAISFDGVNDSVSTNDAYSATNPAGSFSISTWIYPEAVTGGVTTPLVKVSGSYELAIDTTGNLYFSVAGLTPNKINGPQLPINSWSLVQAVYDNTAHQLRLYINGYLVSSVNTTGSVYVTGQRFYLSPGVTYFKGKMDEVRLYSKALTTGDIYGLYSLSTATPQVTATHTPTPTASNTPTPSATPVPNSEYGTGLDGNVTVTGTVNLNTSPLAAGRTCADAPVYSVTQLFGNTAFLSENPASGCLVQGDEVMLLNIQGTNVYYQTGNYEFLRVQSVNGSTVTFTTSVIKWYGAGPYDNTNIGTSSGQQRVVVQRVPNYNNMTVNGALIGSAYNGYRYGALAFRIKGTLSGSGSINMDALGFVGGRGCGGVGIEQWNGQSYNSILGLNGAGAAGPDYDSRYGPTKGGGSGGYSTVGTQGVNGGGSAGRVYGSPELQRIYLGSGGGGEGCDNGSAGGSGGNGGGLIYLSADTISFSGQISARGAAGGGNRPAGGSGGSIWIGGKDILVLDSVSVSGGMGSGDPEPGAAGRVAVYYSNRYDSSFVPGYLRNTGSTPTPQPTLTPIATDSSPYGDGANGSLTIPAGITLNINTQTQSLSFQCADGGDAVSYALTSLNTTWATLSAAPAPGCLNPGDEILLIAMFGASNSTNTGKYEFLRVGGLSGTTLYFQTPKVNFYGDNAEDDSNIGTGSGQRRVIIQRVPNYTNVEINGTLTGTAYSSTTGLYGLLVFRVRDSFTGNGIVNGSTIGYGGGRGCQGGGAEAHSGGSYFGVVGSSGAGVAGPNYDSRYGPTKGGGSGGYRTDGVQGINGGGAAGKRYGTADLSLFYLGSGGGGEGCDNGSAGGDGGNGGGAIYISANMINFTGSITANGANGSGNRPAGGSGGSIWIEGNSISLNSVSVSGGSGGGSPAPGASGRIAVYYASTFSGNFTPGFLLNTTIGLVDSISSDDFESGLDNWVTPVPENLNLSTSEDSAYWGNSGLKVVVVNNTALYAEDDAPDGETSYRARAYFNMDGLTMATNDLFTLFSGQTGANNSFELQVQKTATIKQIRLLIYKDGGTTMATSWYDLTAGWHAFEVQIQASGVAGANDGTANLYLDGILREALAGIDNDTMAIITVRLGVSGIDTGTRGSISFDDFESRRFSTIGLLPDPGEHLAPPTPVGDWENAIYTYASDRPHAVVSVERTDGQNVSTDTYTYDANGNMTCRVEAGKTYVQTYNVENRMSGVEYVTGTCSEPGTTTADWAFTYDGDGSRVKQVYTDGTSTLTTYYFFGGSYEVQDNGTSTITRVYYAFAGMTVALRTIIDSNSTLVYFLTDHLGSIVAVTDAGGNLVSEQRYLPFGQVRTDIHTTDLLGDHTDIAFTGQRNLDAQGATFTIGLMDYKARFYDPYLKRMAQPDSIVPDGNPQSLNKYSYVINSPINLSDPSGHTGVCPGTITPTDDGLCGGGVDYGYSEWAMKVLSNLKAAGPVGVHTADYIIRNNVEISIVDNEATNLWWKIGLGPQGFQIQNTLYVSTYISNKSADDPWVLMEFVLETRHLEQGLPTALSVYGEMEAWQLGFNFYNTLPNHSSLSTFVSELLTLPLSHDESVLRQAQSLINQQENGGTSLLDQIIAAIKGKSVYWIEALPLNPVFPDPSYQPYLYPVPRLDPFKSFIGV
jgi:RHS repeat-associated protein